LPRLLNIKKKQLKFWSQ